MVSVENSRESVGRAIERLDDLMEELGVGLQEEKKKSTQGEH